MIRISYYRQTIRANVRLLCAGSASSMLAIYSTGGYGCIRKPQQLRRYYEALDQLSSTQNCCEMARQACAPAHRPGKLVITGNVAVRTTPPVSAQCSGNIKTSF
jgi:hypothetical protein